MKNTSKITFSAIMSALAVVIMLISYFPYLTYAIPAIAGLCEGLKYIKSRGLDDISAHEEALFLMAREKLCNLSGISMYATQYVGPTLLFNMRGFSSEELARELDSFGICARGGFHCSALAHKTLGTPEGGALRISLGAFNGEADIENLCRALNSIEK